jgi:hypothetical protein
MSASPETVQIVAAGEEMTAQEGNAGAAEEAMATEAGKYLELAHQRAAEMADCLERSREGKDYLANLPAEISNEIFKHLFEGERLVVCGEGEELCQVLLTCKALLQAGRGPLLRQSHLLLHWSPSLGQIQCDQLSGGCREEAAGQIDRVQAQAPPRRHHHHRGHLMRRTASSTEATTEMVRRQGGPGGTLYRHDSRGEFPPSNEMT